MKYFKIILPALFTLVSLGSWAQGLTNGFYRVQSYETQRYVYVIDNRGGLNMATTSADVHALTLWKNLSKAISDPASVIYVNNLSGNDYDFAAQGTSVETLIGMPAKVYTGTDGRYMIYGVKDGLAKYLGDGEKGDIDQGYMSDNAKGDMRYWLFHPISASSDNYFGVKSQVQAQGKYYATMKASWAFNCLSSSTRAMGVSWIDANLGVAVVEPIGTSVAAGTPVLFCMASSDPAANKLTPMTSGGSAPKANQLFGTYFDFEAAEPNWIPYDASTMRVLGKTSDGKAAFVTSTTLRSIPANTCYLAVPENSPANYLIMTPVEYDTYIKSLNVPVTGISLDRSQAEVVEGESFTLTATVEPANATDKTVTWTSSNTQIATVGEQGLVKGIKPGSVRITARAGDFTASCDVTVKKKIIPVSAITLSASSLNLTEGDTFTLTATVSPDNATDKTVHWSSNSSCVTIDASGHGKAMSEGTAIITATAGDCKATCTVTVSPKFIPVTSVTLSSASMSLEEGSSARLTATVKPDNATDKTVTWSSTYPSVATVDAQGNVRAIKTGTTQILAKAGDITARCLLTVTPKRIPVTGLTLQPTSLEITQGETQIITPVITPANATDRTVTWSTSNAGIASVKSDGSVTGVQPGQAVITAKCGSFSATCNVTVTQGNIPVTSVNIEPKSKIITVGETFTVSATYTPANATISGIAYTSSDPSVASVTQQGVVTGLKGGKCEITAMAGSCSDKCTLTVQSNDVPVERVTISPESLSLLTGDEYTLVAQIYPENADYDGMTWASENSSVATVDGQGNVQAVSAGKCNITLKVANVTAYCLVTVTQKQVPVKSISLDPSDLSIAQDATAQITATVLPEDHTETLVWGSSDPEVCTVDANGLVTALAPGRASVTLKTTSTPAKEAACAVIVLPKSGIVDLGDGHESLQVNGNSLKLLNGTAQVYDLNGTLLGTLTPEAAITLPEGAVYILKTVQGTVKIAL